MGRQCGYWRPFRVSDVGNGKAREMTMPVKTRARQVGKVDFEAKAVSRFAESIEPEPNSGCWLWMKSINQSGYGQFSLRSKVLAAHRWIFSHFYDQKIPDGLFVCHKCDTKICVNPQHLFVGSASENNFDCVRKNRHRWRKSPAPYPGL